MHEIAGLFHRDPIEYAPKHCYVTSYFFPNENSSNSANILPPKPPIRVNVQGFSKKNRPKEITMK